MVLSTLASELSDNQLLPCSDVLSEDETCITLGPFSFYTLAPTITLVAVVFRGRHGMACYLGETWHGVCEGWIERSPGVELNGVSHSRLACCSPHFSDGL